MTSPFVQAEGDLSLEAFTSQALKRNLSLRKENALLEEEEARATGINIPSLQVGVSQQGYQVSQTIPFPTKVSSDYRARKQALKARESARQATLQEVRALARVVYFLVWESQEQERILKEKESLLKAHLKIARIVARSDTFSKVHLLKVESELDQVKNDLEAVSQLQVERQGFAAQFLDKDPMTFKFKASEPERLKGLDISPVEKTPQMKVAQSQLKQFDALESVGKSEWLPDLTVSYSRMEKSAMFPENEQITLGVTLPFLYFWQPHSKSSQAAAKKVFAEMNLQETRRKIEFDQVNLSKNIETLGQQIQLLEKTTLPRAFKRKKLFQNISPRDLSSLQEHLDTYLSIPNLELQILSLRSKYEQTLAALVKYK